MSFEYRYRLEVLFIVSVLIGIPHVQGYNRLYEPKCVKMSNEYCRGLGYNYTLIPNVKAGIDKIEEASRRISEFLPLFRVKCYENLQFFICNMFLPVCHSINGNPTPVFPCRHVCEEARKGCEPIMEKYSISWPDVLKCEYLRTENRALCGSPPKPKPTQSTTAVTRSKTLPTWVTIIQQFPRGIDWVGILQKSDNWKIFAKIFGLNTKFSFEKICQQNPKALYVRKNKKEYCWPRCDADATFTSDDKKFTTVWISIWSIICFLSTLLTVSTFLIDHKRFKYPERPIIFLSFCYNLYSVGYLIRVFAGYDSIVCENSPNGEHVLIDGMSVTSCTLVFFFLYYFGMASALWWVILSLTWFLSAALKWGHEAIEKYSSLFHAISWTIPTIQTIIALVTKKVDVDTLSGLCYVGASNSDDLLLLVALPLLIYLLIGSIFLVMGFIALIRIRKELRRERNTNKLERLIVRIGIFSVLYSVPACIVVGCLITEHNRLKSSENKAQDLISCLKDEKCGTEFQPKTELFYLRYFMSLVVGVTSGVWIWTSKTLNSWKAFYVKRICKKITKTEEEKERLYKNSAGSSGQQPRRRVSHEVQYSIVTPNTHGSNPNMIQQQQMYMPPPTQFFFPLPQNKSFKQAHNVAVSQAKMETSSRGFTVTPTSNFVSDIEQYDYNSASFSEMPVGPPPTRIYHPHSSSISDHQSSEHSNCVNLPCTNNTASLPRNSHIPIVPPVSPKSTSTRSHYSTEAKL